MFSCVVLYCVVLYCAVLYCFVLCCFVLFCVLNRVVLYCAVCCVVLFSVVLFVLCCIMLHCVVLVLQGIVLRRTGVCCRSVLCYSVSGGRWQTLCHDADFASYSTLAMSPNTTYLAVASILGHVRVLHRGQEGQFKKQFFLIQFICNIVNN